MSKTEEYKGSTNAIFKGRQNAYGMHFTGRNPCVGWLVLHITIKMPFVTNFFI